MTFGLFLAAVANDLFLVGLVQGWYFSGHPIELIWLWGFVSISLGLWTQKIGL
jgi:hypothetical protein